MRKTKQELQFIIDRVSTTWGITCYLLGMNENSIIYMPHVDDVKILDERNLKIRRREGAEAISRVRSVCENHALPVLLRDGKQVYYFAFP